MKKSNSRDKLISVVVPMKDEEGNVEDLFEEIKMVFNKEKLKGEFIFIDDGSSDKTLEKMLKLKPLKVIVFRKNFGQTAAMDAGIKASKGEIIVTMDGDRQNDPADISAMLDKLDEGFDVVSGWRKNRQDPFFKKILSRGADKLRKFLINDQINDSGCSLKVYRSECFDNIDLYGEMHRFIPGILKIQGFKIGELIVNHRERTAGVTKYNWKRLLKGVLDLISVWFWKKFAHRPLHLFGGGGLICFFAGAVILIWMLFEKFILLNSIGSRIWPLIGIFLMLLGAQFIVSGLLADILIKVYYKSREVTNYNIKEIIEIN